MRVKIFVLLMLLGLLGCENIEEANRKQKCRETTDGGFSCDFEVISTENKKNNIPIEPKPIW